MKEVINLTSLYNQKGEAMDFSSSWTEIAGDIEGVQITPQNGKHNPPWNELDEHTQGIITEICRSAEQIIEEMCITGADDQERRFTIDSTGHINQGDDGPASKVQLNVAETTAK